MYALALALPPSGANVTAYASTLEDAAGGDACEAEADDLLSLGRKKTTIISRWWDTCEEAMQVVENHLN